MDQKYIFAVDGVVLAIIVGHEGNGITFTGPPDSKRYIMPLDTVVGLNWLVSGTDEAPIFTAPEGE